MYQSRQGHIPQCFRQYDQQANMNPLQNNTGIVQEDTSCNTRRLVLDPSKEIESQLTEETYTCIYPDNNSGQN